MESSRSSFWMPRELIRGRIRAHFLSRAGLVCRRERELALKIIRGTAAGAGSLASSRAVLFPWRRASPLPISRACTPCARFKIPPFKILRGLLGAQNLKK